MKCLLLKMLLIFIWLTSMIVCVWYIYSHGNVTPVISHRISRLHLKKSFPNSSRTCFNTGNKNTKVLKQVMERYNEKWKKQEDNMNRLRSELNNSCQGISEAIITQDNTPVGTQIKYDGEKNKLRKVTPNLFSTFSKEQPLKIFIRKTCAVVGNGGILVNSSCGEEINSAQIVIRCNLPPLGDSYNEDVGNKTDLVTANPSILLEKFQGLTEWRRPFLETMSNYGDSLLLLPAFSYIPNMPLSLRALYTLQEFGSPARPVFLNPRYLSCLARFWNSRGLAVARLSTGFIAASLALELCSDVRLYGFWPFPLHPSGCHPLANHYYDNRLGKKVHKMDAEFERLLSLHKEGVLKVHLGECQTDPR
ncbi:alpha-2,8-sialyltransferase 8F-like [Anguilla anguilla]|uniref:alpha-2,8-sialyltransferase 8F-like n=1 Tax=Anguilla anguilla TaxID=7936 RepID=UPI0015AF023C|nr:alpha-2,8-sialyltransferase 8F-like [Anguilla anguilla]